MLSSAPFNQSSNGSMNEYVNYISYNEQYNHSKNDIYLMTNQNIQNENKMYPYQDFDSVYQHSSNKSNGNINMRQDYYDTNLNTLRETELLAHKFHSLSMNGMSRSNSAHNSPFDMNRITPRQNFSQSTANTPLLTLQNRMGCDIDMRSDALQAPIAQLFNSNPTVTNSANNINAKFHNQNNNFGLEGRSSPTELIDYQTQASKLGFLVGKDLEDVLNRSAALKSSNSSRISNFFKHKHGSSCSHLTQKQYLVLGVRVPSKEHVSEIVGKEGKKIKQIRQSSGALITTPNEKEDHVFLVEAIPETAIKVGQTLQRFSENITMNKLGNSGLVTDRPRSPPLLGNRVPLATDTIGVPQRLVGKVIGTQGSIITTVQKETGTEIKSPPKDDMRAPDDNAEFEISVYENPTVSTDESAKIQIHRAKQLIAHLVMRVWEQQPRNPTPCSEDSGTNDCGGYGSGPEWIWSDVARMDEAEAKEIIDRILRSSKAKITPSTSSNEGTAAGLENILLNNAAGAQSSANMNGGGQCSNSSSSVFAMSVFDSHKKSSPPPPGFQNAFKMPVSSSYACQNEDYWAGFSSSMDSQGLRSNHRQNAATNDYMAAQQQNYMLQNDCAFLDNANNNNSCIPSQQYYNNHDSNSPYVHHNGPTVNDKGPHEMPWNHQNMPSYSKAIVDDLKTIWNSPNMTSTDEMPYNPWQIKNHNNIPTQMDTKQHYQTYGAVGDRRNNSMTSIRLNNEDILNNNYNERDL